MRMCNGCFNKLINIVRSTISMRSMLLLGGSGGMPPRKFLKIRYSEIDSDGIFTKNLR